MVPKGTSNLANLCRGSHDDNFTNRIVLSGLPVSGSADNTYATSEPGEPLQGDGRWVWVLDSAAINVGGCGIRLGRTYRVYTGDSLKNLILTPLFTSAGQTVFNATGGVTYQISIDSGWGNFVVSNVLLWAAPLDPPNDYFTNRAMIVGTNAVISAYNGLATSGLRTDRAECRWPNALVDLDCT